ncbi:serine/threonine transporter SstT [Pseudomonas sp. F1_0610]|uniref:serine/threonine transporter SstT n=1 Tax=Pseudomonas sp. F1_0610 TaxID=3114284 RepID=UPI0039C08069
MARINYWLRTLLNTSLVLQIIIGLLLGIIAGFYLEGYKNEFEYLGNLFVSGLKGAAPILIFILCVSAIANHQKGSKIHLKSVLALYFMATFLAAVAAVAASYLFPTTIKLVANAQQLAPPSGLSEVLGNLVAAIFVNPIEALLKANFIGILAWAIALGIALRNASDTTKIILNDLSNGVTFVVRLVIRIAPVGVMGIVAYTIMETGTEGLKDYVHLLVVLLGCMLFVAFVINPILVFAVTKQNPYPLVWQCVRESGITAFFTRSSAANVPVNMALCKKMGLHEDTYSVTIPLGATINMGGAAITITILTLAAVNTIYATPEAIANGSASLFGVVSLPTAILLSFIAAIGACGSSGVAGGSLLLIPLACSIFGISNDVAMMVVGVGVAIGVLQDSTETALNSSTDVLFTAAACIAAERKKSLIAAE